jgi:hypothetical protein
MNPEFKEFRIQKSGLIAPVARGDLPFFWILNSEF